MATVSDAPAADSARRWRLLGVVGAHSRRQCHRSGSGALLVTVPCAPASDVRGTVQDRSDSTDSLGEQEASGDGRPGRPQRGAQRSFCYQTSLNGGIAQSAGLSRMQYSSERSRVQYCAHPSQALPSRLPASARMRPSLGHSCTQRTCTVASRHERAAVAHAYRANATQAHHHRTLPADVRLVRL